MRAAPCTLLLAAAAWFLAEPAAAGAAHRQTTSGAPRSTGLALPGSESGTGSPAAQSTGCTHVVGILGVPLLDPRPFLEDNGLTVLDLDAAAIAGGALGSVDVLYVLRTGVPDAQAEGVAIDAWVRGGGVMLTEFDATVMLFEPGPLNYFVGAVVDDFWKPSGTVCGGNTVVVEDPSHALADGLPASWACSGDPIGVLKVMGGVDPSLCVIASLEGSDRDADGREDPVVGAATVGAGTVIPFFTDFSDWTPLESPRDCTASPLCNRVKEEEILFLNAVCRAAGCAPVVPDCATCDDLLGTIDEADFDREGVRGSFRSQAEAACRALVRGQPAVAGNVLCALLNHCAAQAGRHLDEESALRLRECVVAFAEANAIPLGVPAGACGSLKD